MRVSSSVSDPLKKRKPKVGKRLPTKTVGRPAPTDKRRGPLYPKPK